MPLLAGARSHLTAIIFAACLWVVSGPLVAAQVPRAVPVVVASAEERELAPVTWYAGTLISRNDARLPAEVEARLVWVAEVGTVLAEGEVVARLDDTLIRQALRENEAAVQREKARLTFYDQEVKRLRRLANQQSAAQSQLDQAISERGVIRGELEAARARVEQAKERLQRTEVRSPFAGVVTERLMQAGEWAEGGEAIARLVDPKSLEVQVRVPVGTLPFVAAGDSLRIRSIRHDGMGTVRTAVPVGDDQSRLYELRLALEQDGWSAGQTVRVAVPTDLPRQVVAVPRDALVLRRAGTAVYRILPDDTAERVAVTTGIASGDLIEVRGGIRSGDRVVTRGAERLRPGQKVSVAGASGGPR